MGVQRVETTTGPVAVGGRTINVVARTNALIDGRGSGRLLAAWSRPLHVESLDADGRREIVKVRDFHLVAMALVAGVAAAGVFGTHFARSRR